jgi:hypothetical protein
MWNRPRRLPPAVRSLARAFREGLIQALGDDLASAFLIGSVAFPGYRLESADLDFFVVTHRAVSSGERDRLSRLHRDLARGFQKGDNLDGLYIPLDRASRRIRPRGLAFDAKGRLCFGIQDQAWALHRAHVHAGAFVLLAGRDPRKLLPRASWSEVARDLEHELRLLREALVPYPVYATLDVCRLLYTWKERNPAVSKVFAGRWAVRSLPERWAELAAAALRQYRGAGRPKDRRLVASRVREFYSLARRQVAPRANRP